MLRCVGRTGAPQTTLKPGAKGQRQLALAFRLQGAPCAPRPCSGLSWTSTQLFLQYSVRQALIIFSRSPLPPSPFLLPTFLPLLLPPFSSSLFLFFFHSIVKKEKSMQHFLRSHGSKGRTRCKPRPLSSLVRQGLKSFRPQVQDLKELPPQAARLSPSRKLCSCAHRAEDVSRLESPLSLLEKSSSLANSSRCENLSKTVTVGPRR